jgi:alpha-glucosidase
LLVAPPPFPEQPDSYALKLPPGVWYDYWTGAKIQSVAGQSDSNESLPIQQTLDTLAVYVREGSILPLQPLIQSTEEIPQGPLTLRVYPGNDCRGDLYLDDGKSFAYRQGDFLRIDFSCDVKLGGLHLHIGEHEGAFHPWWHELHVELYGWESPRAEVDSNEAVNPAASVDPLRHVLTFDVPDEVRGTDLEIRKSN